MRASLFIAIVIAAACTHSDREPIPTDEITFTPRGTIRGGDDAPPETGRIPGGEAGVTPVRLDTGWFALTGPAVPGTATFTSAIVWDPFVTDMPPFGSGGMGTEDVTVSGTRHVVTNADAFVMLYTDESGTEYLVLSAFSETSDGAGGWWQSNVAVFVLRSDFAPGTTVALDGIDRVAMFAAGPSSAPEPMIFAAAVTGTVTFGSGTTAVGDRIDASLAADFAPAMPTATPPPRGTPLAAGSYDLVIDPVPDVLCGGTLAGSESSFAGESLAVVGTTDGPVTLSLPAPDAVEMTGATVGAAWGVPFTLDAVVHPPDTFVGMVHLSGTGPASTELAGAYWLVEGMPATPGLVHAAIGLAYVDPIADGGCDVVWYAELRTP